MKPVCVEDSPYLVSIDCNTTDTSELDIIDWNMAVKKRTVIA